MGLRKMLKRTIWVLEGLLIQKLNMLAPKVFSRKARVFSQKVFGMRNGRFFSKWSLMIVKKRNASNHSKFTPFHPGRGFDFMF